MLRVYHYFSVKIKVYVQKPKSNFRFLCYILSYKSKAKCYIFNLLTVCYDHVTHAPVKSTVQMHCTDTYSQRRSIIWLVWLYGWGSVYELSGCGFESSCSHLKFQFITCPDDKNKFGSKYRKITPTQMREAYKNL